MVILWRHWPPTTPDDSVKRGYLYIMMADSTDAGTYTCKATYKGQTYDVAQVKLEVKVGVYFRHFV